ncbi:hypothetical protein ACFUIZ_32445 [Streptomyces cinereoruber]|uniref:DUF6197 family protein n=1 Tax=Streptomyces cinereoruber TaxID=67260 RepID=UPI00363901FA
MNTHTQTSGFTPVDQDLYEKVFQLLDPDPAPEPAAPAAPAPFPPTTTLPMHLTGPVEKVLTDALAFLDTHGWTRYSLINTEGARCSIGAMRGAAGSRNTAYRDAGNLLLHEARRQHGKKWQTIPPGTTATVQRRCVACGRPPSGAPTT